MPSTQQKIVDSLEGTKQIKNDIVVHEKGTELECRLEALFKRFQEYTITLRKEKSQLGMAKVKWFGHIYSNHGISGKVSKVRVIKAWPRRKDKIEVKSFQQIVQFCQAFIKMGQEKEDQKLM